MCVFVCVCVCVCVCVRARARVCVYLIHYAFQSLRDLHQRCVSPEMMDDAQLKQALFARGKSINGSRETLVYRYLKSDTSK